MEQTLGRQLTSLREAKGLTQDELASMSGISRPQISRLENDEVDAPRRTTLDKLAKVLGIQAGSLQVSSSPPRRSHASDGIEADQLARFENVILHEKISEQQDELINRDEEITKLRAMVAYLSSELGKFGSSLEAAWSGLQPVGPRAGALVPA